MATVPLCVAVRIRPPQPHDGKVGPPAVVPLDGERLRLDPEGANREFAFDRVFGPEASQHEVYAACALPVVEAVLEARNGCIFAFGCTGAGKTHSMLGPEGGRKRTSEDGLLPRAAAELFRRLAQLECDARGAAGAAACAYEVRASFLEVYRELAFDLLAGPVSASRDPAGACALREDKDGRVYAEGAAEVPVRSAARVLELVAQGAAARATAATGVHAHSSRSHALLVLNVEKRWRDAGDPNLRRVKSQTARLTMVDLAGAEGMERAHGGNADAAGVGTNMGLLVLGRVIQALASRERVPFRDSTLTRLMQSCLVGNAATQMLACVSPVAHEAGVTQHTLGYASSARTVRLGAGAAKVHEEYDDDPMLDDVDDEDVELQRRAIWIDTPFGEVFARCAGDAAEPLILYVHGSGPRNSSMTWNLLAEDLTRLGRERGGKSAPARFFHVAIDCPGYGRSPGDRQVIRSYPGQLISSIVASLGRKSVAALVGSSQGACAVFNCALECPELAHTLAVCHPVGHAPQRYTAVAQPALLIFDTEDAGHPVSVGRQMRRYLPNPRYFEFARSKDGDWEVKHMGEELYAMLSEHWSNIGKKRRGGRRDNRLPELTRMAGGFRSWAEAHNEEWLPWCGVADEPLDGEDAVGGAGADDSNLWRARVDLATGVMLYEHVHTGRQSKVRPPGARVLVEQLGGPSGVAALSQDTGVEPLFEGYDANDESSCDEEEKEARARAADAQRLQEEASQTDCSLCTRPLLEPVRLVKCRCALCACCVERTVRFTRQCPRCGDAVELALGAPASDVSAELVQCLGSRAPDAALQEQMQRVQQLQLARTRVSRLVLEYGNTSSTQGSKTTFTTFCRVAKTEGAAATKDAVARVDFNINPSYNKPTASEKAPMDKKLGFTFTYAMARPYPCFITVHFQSSLGLPKLLIQFDVQPQPKLARRIVLELPVGGGRPGADIVFKADEPEGPRNGWVRGIAGRGATASVEYLPEPQDPR